MDLGNGWALIEEFPDYLVSVTGQVFRSSSQRPVAVSFNQQGIAKVGLMQNGVQRHRSLAKLVAEAHLPRHINPTFDTPIHLNGDRSNCAVGNLAWRPRWFAWKYHHQFVEPYHNPINVPLYDQETGERYENSLHVAMVNGVMEKDVVRAVLNRTYVWPVFKVFA